MEAKNVIELIKKIRKEKGYTQGFVAEKLKLTQAAYGKIERGNVGIDIAKVLKLLKIINVEPHVFFSSVFGKDEAFTCTPRQTVFNENQKKEILQSIVQQNKRTKKNIEQSEDLEVTRYFQQREKIQLEIIDQLNKELTQKP